MFPSRLDSRLFCVFLLLVVPALATAQSNNLFSAIALNPVGTLPQAIASGDFNGDGFPDRAVANCVGGTVSILLGTGDGNFQPAVNDTVGQCPTALAVGDFNHDGHLDLAVANYGNPSKEGSIEILLGRGDGTFVTGTSNLLIGPEAIVAGDLDGDGTLDLAVMIDDYNGNLSVNTLRGNGDGTFQTGKSYGVGNGIGTGSLALGDFTGDGKPDLVFFSVANGTSVIGTLVNNGSGDFNGEVACTLGTQQGWPSLAVADFNNDGILDVAVALASTSSVVICQGKGDGTFSIASSATVGANPIGLAAGDLNGDGKIDLVASNYTDGTVSVLLGNGTGAFTNVATYPVGTQPVALLLGDLNGDGKLDATVLNSADNNAEVLLGKGDGTLFVGTYRVGANAGGIASGDFNHDGIPDLVVTNANGTATVFLGNGRGGFKALSPFSACQDISGDIPGQVLAADINADGIPDLAIWCSHDNFVNLFQGNGDGTFSNPFGWGLGSPFYGMIAADVNGDGVPEVVSATGAFLSAFNFNPSFFNVILHNDFLQGISLGDFNGDGKTDLLPLGTSLVLLADGTGHFQEATTSQFGGLTGDFNGDGLTDFESETSSGDNPQLQISLSNGDGTFRNGFELSSNRLGQLQTVADFNGDGILDLLSVALSPAPFNVFFGKDDATFLDAGISTPSFADGSVATVADFDGNGSPDVAVLDPSAGTVSILLNKNSFQPTTTLLSESPGKVVVGASLTLSAAVAAKQGTPTGNVEFKQGGVPQTTIPLSGAIAQATLTAPTTTGTFGYTALYTGDGTFGGSLSQRVLITVTPATSSTTISTSISPSGFGQNVTFTANVKPEYSGSPTGSVAFYSDGQPIGTATVSGGQAALTVNSLAIGIHTIEADYSGDASFITSLGRIKQKVVKGTDTFVLTSALNPAVYGQPVTLTATATNSAGTPTGFVVFSEGSKTYGSVNLSGGIAQLTLPQLLVGNHRITAQYSGDSYNVAAKATLVEAIKAASSTTSVTSSLDPSVVNQSVTFTAVVSSATGVPDGTVTFKTGQQTLGAVALSGGHAQLSISTLKAGTHTITAVYAGNGKFGKSQGSVQQVVEHAP